MPVHRLANRVRHSVRYCYFSALKILVVFLQTHGFVLAFRENYNLPIYRWVGSRPPALAEEY